MTVSPFGLPPEEAVKWFRRKGYELSFHWDEIWREEHARAFTVAKATQLTILSYIRKHVDSAIANGTSLREFQKQLTPFLQKNGWWGRKTVDVVDRSGNPVLGKDGKPLQQEGVQLGSPHRLRTIYETNLRAALAAGRWERIKNTAKARPYLRYVAIDDGRTRKQHLAWHGTILPWDHSWWQTHAPPNGWGCRCKIQQLSEADLQRFGLQVSEAPRVTYTTLVNKRTGEVRHVPAGIDPSFDYNPGTGRSLPIEKPIAAPWQAPPTTPTASGILNEAHKKFLATERAIADMLVTEGHNVSSRTESKVAGAGRKYDALVNDQPVEFKRPTKGGTIRSLLTNSAKGTGQAPSIIIDVRGQPTTEAQARAQVTEAVPELRGKIYYVRIVGDGFNFTVTVSPNP